VPQISDDSIFASWMRLKTKRSFQMTKLTQPVSLNDLRVLLCNVCILKTERRNVVETIMKEPYSVDKHIVSTTFQR